VLDAAGLLVAWEEAGVIRLGGIGYDGAPHAPIELARTDSPPLLATAGELTLLVWTGAVLSFRGRNAFVYSRASRVFVPESDPRGRVVRH
jgi:hypothetical protein